MWEVHIGIFQECTLHEVMVVEYCNWKDKQESHLNINYH